MDDSIPNNTDLAIAERDIFGKDPKDFLLLDSFDQLTSATLGTAETQQLARGLSFAADGSLWFCQETEASAKSKSSAGAHFILMRYLSQELWNTESAAWEAADPTTQGAKRERTNMEDRAEE